MQQRTRRAWSGFNLWEGERYRRMGEDHRLYFFLFQLDQPNRQPASQPAAIFRFPLPFFFPFLFPSTFDFLYVSLFFAFFTPTFPFLSSLYSLHHPAFLLFIYSSSPVCYYLGPRSHNTNTPTHERSFTLQLPWTPRPPILLLFSCFFKCRLVLHRPSLLGLLE